MYISLDYFYFWQYLTSRFGGLFRFKKADALTTENTHEVEPTGTSRLSIIENKVKNKNENDEGKE